MDDLPSDHIRLLHIEAGSDKTADQAAQGAARPTRPTFSANSAQVR
jgi:hypothetical protein